MTVWLTKETFVKEGTYLGSVHPPATRIALQLHLIVGCRGPYGQFTGFIGSFVGFELPLWENWLCKRWNTISTRVMCFYYSVLDDWQLFFHQEMSLSAIFLVASRYLAEHTQFSVRAHNSRKTARFPRWDPHISVFLCHPSQTNRKQNRLMAGKKTQAWAQTFFFQGRAIHASLNEPKNT